MKRTYINGMGIAFSALLCLCLALPASAQRPANGGGGNSSSGNSGGNSGGAKRWWRKAINGRRRWPKRPKAIL